MDKTAFFESLYKLDSESCSDPDDEPSVEDLHLHRLFTANRRDREHCKPNTRQHKHNDLRDLLPPQLQHRSTAPASASASFHDNSNSLRTTAPLRRVNTISELDSSTITKVTMPKRARQDVAATTSSKADGKKPTKRAKIAKQPPMQPLERQVFKNLVFYFIKPDEKRAERKMRMDKAREYGAQVVFEFTKDVTHIICDKDFNYHDVITFLKMKSFPPKVAVTNPRWPGDCIKYSKLVTPTDFWYQVPDCPEEDHIAAPGRSDALLSSSPPHSSPSSSLQVQARPTPKKQADTPQSTPPEPQSSPVRPAVIPKNREPVKTNDTDDSSQPRDALDEAIEECLASGAINVEDFMDEEPDGPNATNINSDSATGDNSSSSSDEANSSQPPPKHKKTGSTSAGNWQSHFQCMHKHDGQEGSQNPNTRTIHVLQEMMRVYDDMRDQWRTRSYRIAISSLKKEQSKYISTYDDAISLPGVGERLAKKIVEIATTDRLQRLEYAKLDPQDQILKIFHGIYGVGLVQARKFVAAGYKTLEDVKKSAVLTEPQRIGVEHYEDFAQRIPREEVAEHGEIVAEAIKKNAGVEELHDVLKKLVEKLFKQKFLMCGLAIARHEDGTKWHGASRIGGPDSTEPWRRIDFLVVPGEEIGAAFLYFTGNDVFNRSMRLLASKKGMRLNQRGLYRDVMRGKNREKFNEGTLLESKSEMKIFEILGVPYRPPEHRIC
ncbi:hypothetical protein ABW20_dc0106453 [Dactylellina cionopaga]|nr:hypothetical protein ABW20_dc0106453 [Dactylellina cionopaga]